MGEASFEFHSPSVRLFLTLDGRLSRDFRDHPHFDIPNAAMLNFRKLLSLMFIHRWGSQWVEVTVSRQGAHVVIVVGAGPAGMSVANIMSKAGHEVIILNRDIKFGGLAEYGIFPSKLKLRGGLRKTYWEVVERPNVHYFGNVSIGQSKALTVEDLRALAPVRWCLPPAHKGRRRSAWKAIPRRACSTRKTSSTISIDCRGLENAL